MGIMDKAGALLSALAANGENTMRLAGKTIENASTAWMVGRGFSPERAARALARHPAAVGAAYGRARSLSFAKGIGIHALGGAVIGGGMSAYNGQDVMHGAMRGAMWGAMAGVGGSAWRNRKGLGQFKRAAGKDIRAYIASKGAL